VRLLERLPAAPALHQVLGPQARRWRPGGPSPWGPSGHDPARARSAPRSRDLTAAACGSPSSSGDARAPHLEGRAATSGAVEHVAAREEAERRPRHRAWTAPQATPAHRAAPRRPSFLERTFPPARSDRHKASTTDFHVTGRHVRARPARRPDAAAAPRPPARDGVEVTPGTCEMPVMTAGRCTRVLATWGPVLRSPSTSAARDGRGRRMPAGENARVIPSQVRLQNLTPHREYRGPATEEPVAACSDASNWIRVGSTRLRRPVHVPRSRSDPPTRRLLRRPSRSGRPPPRACTRDPGPRLRNRHRDRGVWLAPGQARRRVVG